MSPGRVVACAVIGRENDVLMVRHPTGNWTLPGASVETGEWIGDALARAVREITGSGVDSATFLCLIESTDGLFVVFDVTPEPEVGLPTGERQPDVLWVDPDHGSLDLRLGALRDVLCSGEPPAWFPHQAT
jgi:hypothetical protein